jgi:hypothetical protein
MGKLFSGISDSHRDFIERQHIFFTASAAPGTRINLSPRSTDTFRVLGPNAVVYLDRTGSGNETAAHLLADGRLTIMFCAFEGTPMILRLFGSGRVLHRDGLDYAGLVETAFNGWQPAGARQIVRLDIDLVQSSCGFGVPLFEYQSDRTLLERWAESKGPAGIDEYWREKNLRSIDGLPTGLLEDVAE